MLGEFATKFWPKDWEQQVLEAVRSQGYLTVADFLAANPNRGYRELSQKLGIKMVPYMLRKLQYREASGHSELRAAAIDAFVRLFQDLNPRGWGNYADAPAGAKETSLVSLLSGEMKQFDQAQSVALLGLYADILKSQPTIGWLPTSSADPVLQAAFERCWPDSPHNIQE